MKRIYAYVAALALTFGLTAGIYAGTGLASGQSEVQTEMTDNDDPPTGGDDETPSGGGDETPSGGGDETPSGGGDDNPSGGGGDNPSGGGDDNPSGGGDDNPSGGGDDNPSGGGDDTPAYELKGVGTLVNPYTIEDINHIDLNNTEINTTGVWVKAIVYGYVNGESFSAASIVNSATMPADQIIYNYALMDAGLEYDAEAEMPSTTMMAPAMLGGDCENSKTVRTRLNLGVNPSFLGSTIWLFGTIAKFKGVNGLIDTNLYSLDGSTVLPEEDTPPPTPQVYNLWVGNTQVSTSNADDIKSGIIQKGTVSFEEATKTLVLKDVNFEFDQHENTGFAIKSELDGLTIRVEGKVTFSSMTMYLTGSTTIEGTTGATVAFSGGRTLRAYNTALTIKDLTLTIAPGKVGLDLTGSTVAFIKANVILTGCTPPINCVSEPTYEGCRIVSATPSDDIAFNPSLGYYQATNIETGEREMVTSLYISTQSAPVNRKSCELTVSSGITSYNLTPAQAQTFVAPTGKTVAGYDGEITYRSSNSSLISVNETSGQLTFHNPGTVTITIFASTTDKYYGASVTYTVAYGKEDPELKFAQDEVTMPIGAYAHQYGLYPTKRTPADYTLTSSNPNVISLDDFGGIHIGVAGTTVLTATVPETDCYLAGKATCTVHVVESMSSNLRFPEDKVTVEFGQEQSFISQRPTSATGYTGTITYSSSNQNVATVDELTGEVTLVAPGTTIITARAPSSGSYLSSTAQYTLTYGKATPTLAFNSSLLKVKLSQGTAKLPTLINPTGGEVTYRSSAPSVVSVDPVAGTLTLLKVGTATITATLAETDYYKSASVTCDVQVSSDNTEVTNLEVLPSGLSFEAAGGQKHIRLQSDRVWTASAGQPWIIVSPTSGDATHEPGTQARDDDAILLTVVCTENTSEDARSTEITIKSGSEIQKVTILQDGTHDVGPVIDERNVPKFSVSPSNIDLVVTRSNITLPALIIRYTGDDASEISYESSDDNVVRVDANGIHVVGQGEAVLKVKASGTEFWKPAEATVTINASFPDPDLVEDIEPISGNITVDFSALAGKDMSTGGVQDNIYYSFNTDLSVGDGYSEADGCIVLNSTMSLEQMQKVFTQTLAELDEDGQFRGIIFKVPAGEGSIILDCQTGSNPLMVQMVADQAKRFLISPRGECKVDYNVEEPTLVYIYAMEMPNSTSPLRSVRRVPKKSDATSVLIYGLKVNTVADGVSGVKADTEGEDVDLFNVGGQQVAKKNARHGVFIGTDGSKRAVK